ncbi:MAG: hypothetical protein KTR15_11660 [Phycisphaeraceae bacterium]|nr:hypothetical protein [Phycisphaeraceae bacterium]
MHYKQNRSKKANFWAVVEIMPHVFECWLVVDYAMIDDEPVAILMGPHGPERSDQVAVYGFTTKKPSARETW